MKKSVYSLMLDDGVVAEIDRLAYAQNTNRSNMVNRILAEYASYVTPEQKMREAFDKIAAMLDGQDSFRRMLPTSDTMLSLRSALMYKYNPTVRYSVELYRGAPNGEVGELRVTMRTQNARLTEELSRFFSLWAAAEGHHPSVPPSFFADGKYTRRLILRRNHAADSETLTPETVGEVIAAYIRTFDHAMKAYFRLADQPDAAAAAVSEIYEPYDRKNGLLI